MPAQLFESDFFYIERNGITLESVNQFPTIANQEILAKLSRNEELSRLSQQAQTICPSCGRGLIVIKNKYAGGQFKGCSKYPECRFSENI